MGKEAFYASLCYQGITGGAIYVDADSVVYKNQTLTLPEAYTNIVENNNKNEKRGCKKTYA